MTEASKLMKGGKQIENLELNRETLQELGAEQAERAEGGRMAAASDKETCQCTVVCSGSCFICR
jgi:hypothetical protein